VAKIKKVEYKGRWYDSKAECGRFIELETMQARGEVDHIVCQPGPWRLHCWGGRNHPIEKDRCLLGVYTPDFAYWDHRLGETVVEDVKGYDGGKGYALFNYKCKIMLLEHGITIVPVYNTNNRLTKIYEETTGEKVSTSKSRTRVPRYRKRPAGRRPTRRA